MPPKYLARFLEKNAHAASRADKDVGVVVALESQTIVVYMVGMQILLKFHPSQLLHTIDTSASKIVARKRSWSGKHKHVQSEQPSPKLSRVTPFRSPLHCRYRVSGVAGTGTSEVNALKKGQAPEVEDGVHLVPPPHDPGPRYAYKQRALCTVSSVSWSPRQLEQHLSRYYERLRGETTSSAEESKHFSILGEHSAFQVSAHASVDCEFGDDEVYNDIVYGAGMFYDL